MGTNDPTEAFVTPRVAAGVLFTDDQDRILMVVPTYKDYLDIPGGYVEHGETPSQAAQREVFEEIGIKPPIGKLLVTDWWNDSPETGGGAKLLFIFDGGQLTREQIDEVAVDGEEIREVRFCNPEQIESMTIHRLANRLHHALKSRHGYTYLEQGNPMLPLD